MLLLGLSIFTLIINLPFGMWRARTRRFSVQWFLAIHLPVPLIIIFRYGSGFGFGILPLLLAMAVFGQYLGGRLWELRRGSSNTLS